MLIIGLLLLKYHPAIREYLMYHQPMMVSESQSTRKKIGEHKTHAKTSTLKRLCLYHKIMLS